MVKYGMYSSHALSWGGDGDAGHRFGRYCFAARSAAQLAGDRQQIYSSKYANGVMISPRPDASAVGPPIQKGTSEPSCAPNCCNCNWLVTDSKYIPPNMNNLAMKAVTLMQQQFPSVSPLEVTLQKRIPVAAGLAGGSTDCAAGMLGMVPCSTANSDTP